MLHGGSSSSTISMISMPNMCGDYRSVGKGDDNTPSDTNECISYRGTSHCKAQPWECNESQCDLYYQATVLVRLPLIWASASLIGTELVLPEMACSSGIVCWHQRRKMSLPWLWRTRNMKYTERSRGEETLMYIISLSGPFPTDSNHMSSYMTVKRDRNVENRLRRCSGIRHGISALLGSHTWSNTSFGSANRYMGRYLWKLLNDTAMTLFQTATFGDPSEMLRTCQFDGTKAALITAS